MNEWFKKCPVCNGELREGGDSGIDGFHYHMFVVCKECGKEYTLYYNPAELIECESPNSATTRVWTETSTWKQ